MNSYKPFMTGRHASLAVLWLTHAEAVEQVAHLRSRNAVCCVRRSRLSIGHTHLFPALLLLLRFPLAQFALVDAFRNDGFGGEFAVFKLRPGGLFFAAGILWPDFGVLVARKGGAAFHLLPISRADLHEFGFRDDRLGDVRIHLRLLAGRRGALC